LEVIFFGVFFGQVWGNLGKNLSHPSKFACLPDPTPMIAHQFGMLFGIILDVRRGRDRDQVSRLHHWH